PDAAGDQRLGQRHGMPDIFDGNDRDHRRCAHDFQQGQVHGAFLTRKSSSLPGSQPIWEPGRLISGSTDSSGGGRPKVAAPSSAVETVARKWANNSRPMPTWLEAR